MVGEKWLTIHWPGSPSLGQVALWNQRRDPWNRLPATPLPTPGQNSSGRISPEQGGVLPAPPFAFSPPCPASDLGLWGCLSSPTAARGTLILALITFNRAQTPALLSRRVTWGSNCFMGFSHSEKRGEVPGTWAGFLRLLFHSCCPVNASHVPKGPGLGGPAMGGHLWALSTSKWLTENIPGLALLFGESGHIPTLPQSQTEPSILPDPRARLHLAKPGATQSPPPPPPSRDPPSVHCTPKADLSHLPRLVTA